MDVNRSSENINMDEVDRAMSSAYSTAVSGLSQLYHLGQSQQMLAFRAGERHSLEKVRQWILGRWEEGYRPTVAEIDAYIQHEIGSDGVNSTRITTQHQQTRMSTSMSMASSVTPVQCGAERNNNRMFPTAPSRFSRGEQQPSLIQPGRYYHGDGSRFHSASNEETMEPHIAQPRNSETQGQEWAMVQCGAERNNNRMFPTAPSRFSRGEQQPSLIQPGRYYHGDGSRFHSVSNEETMEPHIAQPRNSETQGQEWAMDLNVYDPQFNWKHG